MADGVSVAVVDDDPWALEALTGLVRALGFDATGFACAEDLLRDAGPNDFACLLSDFRMSGLSGLELASRLGRWNPPVPTVLVTAHADEIPPGAATRAGVVAVLAKPVGPDELEAAIRLAIAAPGPRGPERPR